MKTILKYDDYCKELMLSNNTNDSDSFKDLLKEYEECQALVDSILTQFSEIDSSIMNYLENTWNFADTFFTAAERESEKRRPNELQVGANAVLGLGVAVVGGVSAGIKKIKANIERRRQLDEALIVKQKVADEKFDLISEQLMKMRNGFFSKIQKLYEKESLRIVKIDDELFRKKILIFKQSFILSIKCRFLEGAIEFVLAEMDAWKRGKDDSGYQQHTIRDYIEMELMKWPGKIGKCMDWDQFIVKQMESEETIIPIQTAFLFSEPALVSRYVGVTLEDYENCKGGHIAITPDEICLGGRAVQPLLEKNSYIKDCKEIVEKYHTDPAPKVKFSWVDMLIMILFPAAICYCGIQISIEFQSWFWRILFGLVSAFLIFLLLGSFDYFSNKDLKYKKVGLDLYQRLIEGLLPYVEKNMLLDKKQNNQRQLIMDQERELRNHYNTI